VRTALIEEREFACPRYVRRVEDGWQTYLPGEDTLFFPDAAHGDIARAHQAACAHRLERLPWRAEDQGSYFKHQEREDKREPLGVPGVFLVQRPSGRIELQVRVRRLPMFPVVLGHVLGPWRDKLPTYLEIAKQAHARMIEMRDGPKGRARPLPSAAADLNPSPQG
jgi:hypothetical protein